MSDQRILVVVDPTAEEQPAVQRAARLAQAYGASLELFVCDYDQSLASLPRFDLKTAEPARRAVLEGHLAKLDALRAPLAAQGLSVEIDARWARPLHRGIVDKVAEARPMLVVKDTHEHPVLRRTLLSNTDWNLIRACPAPLLLVKPRPLGTTPRVLAAVDPVHEHDKPADLDRAILGFAAELARRLGGALHVLHAFDPAPLYAAAADTPLSMTSVPPPELIADLEAQHRDALDALVADFAIDKANVRFEEGAPHRAIAEVAEQEQADFVVMGAVSRSGLERIFVGSTAERALDRLPCDLIVVKRPGFRAPAGD
ncbi:MAG TPA: universal stress protein [Gammaproteobacteria bacterium]